MAREIRENQEYKDRLLKLIPSEIVAVYMVSAGVIPQESAKWGTLFVSMVLLILVPFYLWRIQSVKRIAQIVVTMISFVVWVYSLGGPFAAWNLYISWLASVTLVLWTLIVPIAINPKAE